MRRFLLLFTVICGAIVTPLSVSAQWMPMRRQLADTIILRDSVVATAPVAPAVAKPSSAASAMGAKARARIDSVVAMARAQLDKRYRFGGETPKGFDCSGLVRYVMAALDVSLPRTAKEQARVGAEVPTDTAQLRPGDLLLFGRKGRVTHIGIYVGEGRMVHASTKAHRVVERPLLRKPAPGIVPWIGARRLLATTDTLTVTPRRDSLPNGG
ncbi:MAG TPA: C40 family peptidase [Gemmatimonadaceae bacterium]